MENSQKLAVRLSEIRQRLNEIAGLDDEAMTDEVRAETDKLTSEYQTKETQHRAALVGEADEARAAVDDFNAGGGDGEAAEVRALRGRVRIGSTAAALVERYAPGAPQAVRNEAAARCAGWLFEAPASGARMEAQGEVRTAFSPAATGALRSSGAMGLLSPWKVRRAGAIA